MTISLKDVLALVPAEHEIDAFDVESEIDFRLKDSAWLAERTKGRPGAYSWVVMSEGILSKEIIDEVKAKYLAAGFGRVEFSTALDTEVGEKWICELYQKASGE